MRVLSLFQLFPHWVQFRTRTHKRAMSPNPTIPSRIPRICAGETYRRPEATQAQGSGLSRENPVCSGTSEGLGGRNPVHAGLRGPASL